MSETLTGTYTSGVTLTGNPATITGQARVVNTAATGAAVTGPGATNGTLTNQGTVAESGISSGVGISFTTAGTVINSGSVSGNYAVAGGAGISLAAGGSVTNQSGGTVTGRIAVNVSSATAAVVNAGVITGNQTATPGDGVALHFGGSVTNQAGGTISGFYGVLGQTHTINVINQGTIAGNSSSTLGIGVYLSAGGTLTNSASAAVTGFNAIYAKAATTLDNAGQITGSLSNSRAVGAYMKGGGFVTNEVTGTLTGFRAVFSAGAGIVNSGSIGGNMTVGTGAGIFLSNSGSVAVTNQAGGTITGVAGIVGNAGVATIVNSGSIAGNNTSGSGVTLGSGGTVTNLAGGTISGSYGVGAVAVAATVVNAGYLGDGTLLSTGAGIALKHGGVVTNQSGGKIIAGLQGVYFGGAAGTLVNAGTVKGNSSSGNGLIVVNGGALTNQSGGVITGRYGVRAVTTAFTVVNAGSIGSSGTNAAGINLGAGGSVTNQVGGTITGTTAVRMTAGTTVENAGSIGGTTAVSFAAGGANRLIVDAGAAFTGTVTGGNTIGASTASTLEFTAGTGTIGGIGTQFINFAQTTIDAGANWTLTGTNSVVAGATVTNSGTLSDFGTLTNRGTIINTGTTNPSYGAILQTGAMFTNAGSTSLIEGQVGLEVVSLATINAAGTIASILGTAGTAISFFGNGNRLIDNVGAVFIGGISGISSGGNTLELASASSAGTVSGVGTTITNFSTILFDAGAQWTVVGNGGSSGLGGTVAIQGFASGDTIDLTGFAAVSRTFASNSLTLTDGDSNQTALVIQGGFSTSNFVIASDGNGGTDITLVTNLLYAQTVDQAGIVATSETVTAGTMTLFNGGGTAVGSITVGTSLSTGDFGLTSDGAGGTDVIVQTAFGTYTNGLTLLVNPTTIGSLATVSGTGASAVGVGGPLGTNWTLTNLGTVSETGTGSIGVSLAAAGTITNAAGGTISARQTGISLAAGGMVSAQVSGSISGIVGIQASGAAATIVNAGSIAGDSTVGSGITLIAGGSVTNQAGGTISGFYGVSAGVVAATIVNAGAIGAGTSSNGIVLALGSSVTNQSGGRIVAGAKGVFFAGAGSTLVNAGTVAAVGTDGSAMLIVGGGAVTNQTGGTITGKYGVTGLAAASTIVNTGSIGGSSVSGTGIHLAAGGSVTNLSGGTITGAFAVQVTAGTTIENAGSIGGATAAVSFASGAGNRLLVDPGATFTGQVNGGNTIGSSFVSTLELTAGSGTLTGLGTQFVNFAQTTIDSGASWTLSGSNTIVNTIVAGTTVTVNGTLNDTGTLINRGAISASNFGIIVQSGGSVTNLGSASLIEGLTGVQLGGNATLNNFGTIASTAGTAGAAITMLGGSDRVIDNPGAVFTGHIEAAGQNVLELASADSAGTVAGLGTSITNFSSLVFDTGAQWTVVGNLGVNGLGGTTVIQGFAVGDTIDTTGFVATSRSFANNVLTLTDSNNLQNTLHIQGSFSTSNFVIASDGAGGTDITLQNLAPPVIIGTSAGQTVNDNATVQPLSGVTITDPNPLPESETVTITLTAASTPTDLDGTLFGAGLTKTGTGTYTLTAASASAATTAVDALVFTPAAHLTSPGSVVTTGFTVAVTDTAAETATNSTTTVLATAVNDPPVITGTVAGQTETDAQTIQPFSGVTIVDPDLGASETVSITLEDGGTATDADGTLFGTGLTRTGTGTYTLAAGTPSAVTAALEQLVFVPVAVAPPGQTVTTTMTLSVTDGIVSSPTTDSTTSVLTTELTVPCFAAGTRIATPRGAVPVERLREGDVLLTLSGRPRAIQWIGTRTVDCRRHARPERVKPIRIEAHAFGENRPSRPLFLSPDHSVFVEDVLIPVKHLVNDTTITQVNVRTVTYYHIELPAHDVVLAEGLPTETYLETGGRMAFENGGGAMQLHPDFAPDEARVAMVWQNFGYAPLIGSNGELERLQSRLATQAIMLGYRPGEAAKPSRKAARR
jgi:hypothetical protein